LKCDDLEQKDLKNYKMCDGLDFGRCEQFKAKIRNRSNGEGFLVLLIY